MNIFSILLIGFLSFTPKAKYEYKFQDPSLPVEVRVDDLVSRMTMREKVSQLFNQSEPIERLGIPAYNWWNECLHGVARAGKATVFPQAIGLAATFDKDLMFRVADAISDEARAKHHYFIANNIRSIYTGLTFWTPNINIFRDPRWGRGQETYGEDPFLTGKMAVNFIKGLQGNNPKYLKTVATAKHYAVHSGPEFTRHTDNIFINDRDLYDTYLPAFKAVIEDADVQSIMCAYNRFRDKPCCGNDILLSNILRNRFGFNGYVVSDCGAITDFFDPAAHHIVPTSSQAWGWSLSAGTDLNCELSRKFILSNLDSVLRVGILNESDINNSVKRLYKARFMLGMFDPEDQVEYTKIPYSVVGSEKNLNLALEAAEKSLVLLKNNGILPLKNVKKVALIGPNANNSDILTSNYNGIPIQPVSPLKGLCDKLGIQNVLYSQGCPLVPGMFTDFKIIDAVNFFHNQNGTLKKGLKAEYFANTKCEGEPKQVRIDSKIDFYWTKCPLNNLPEDQFSVRWSGVLIPEKSGTFRFGGNVKIKIDNMAPDNNGIALEKGKKYMINAELIVESSPYTNSIEPSASLSWIDIARDYRKEALEAASKADVVIFCGGISADLEGEEMPLEIDGFSHGDRTHLNLPSIQEDLLKQLQATGKPIVYVNFSGSAMSLNWESENVSAIIQGFYPGENTGTALTRLLFGEVNASGRLPVTFYKSVNDLPDFGDYSMQNRTYRYFKGEPLYPFGFGLSYTSFRYDKLEIVKDATANADVTVKVNVTNTGKMDGDEVVQLYLSHKNSSYITPVQALKGFQRIHLKKGENKTVAFKLSADELMEIDNEGKSIPLTGDVVISIGGCQPTEAIIKKNNALQGVISLSAGK